MHIYVVYAAGQQRSLGMVTGLTRRTLVIPAQVIQTLSGIQLFADPIGTDRGYVSQTLLAYPGPANPLHDPEPTQPLDGLGRVENRDG